MAIDQIINDAFEPISEAVLNFVFYAVPITDNLEVRLILVWLVFAALFFTTYLGFVNLRYFGHAINILRGKYDDPREEGEISRFQALAASLSGTVGLGNIAGVAVAISVGGPGAMFWMILMGIFSMATKFTEVVAGVKYRRHMDPDHPDSISGGPMYYLKDAFENRNIPVLGPVIAGLFAICCMGGSIGGGNMFQSNQAYQQVLNVTGGAESVLADYAWLFGLGLSFLVGIVIIGGIKSIANVASKLVPAMGIIYMLAAIIVIALHLENVPQAMQAIIHSAFSLDAGLGGLIGGLLVGVQRAAFSNEAGLGSASIVHSTARCDSPVQQGMVAMLGPFIDTVVICTMTALVIVITGVYQNADGVEGVQLTSEAFASGISWFPYVLALTVFLFAYSTMITWSYYGVKAATYLLGEKPWVEIGFKLIFCVSVVIGASTNLSSIINFSDAMLLWMGIPNLIGLYLLAPEIRRDLKAYRETL